MRNLALKFDNFIEVNLETDEEVKPGRKGSMRSLRVLMEEKGLNRGVRLSEENFGSLEDGRIQIVPLYFAGGIASFLP